MLLRSGELFGIPNGTIRVALSRMVRKREVMPLDDGRYALTGHLLRRQEHQEEGRRPRLRKWRGAWMTAVVRTWGSPPADRAFLRRNLKTMRMAELRDGVWARPDNLYMPRPHDLPHFECLWGTTRFETDSQGIVHVLWNTKAWAKEAVSLTRQMAMWRHLPPDVELLVPGFELSAAVLRHFNADPLLPPELLPADWPGDRLRREYETFNRKFLDLWRSFMGRDGAWDR